MAIETIIESGWLKARVVTPAGAEPALWVIVTSDEGISCVEMLRKSESLWYVSYMREGVRRKRMLVQVGKSITASQEMRADRRR